MATRRKRTVIMAALAMMAWAGAARGEVNFASSRHVKVKGMMEAQVVFKLKDAAELYSDKNKSQAQTEAEFQLKFGIGQNRFKDSAFRHGPIEVTRLERVDQNYGRGYYRTQVTATKLRSDVSNQTIMVLPVRSDPGFIVKIVESFPTCYEKTREELIQKYGAAGWHAMAFYYFQPTKANCPLGRAGAYNDILVRSVVPLAMTADNVDSKMPKYDEIWRDKKFRATIVFGTNEKFVDTDEGVKAYVAFFNWLFQGWRQYLVYSSLYGASPGVARPDAKLVFDFRNGYSAEFDLLLFPYDWESGEMQLANGMSRNFKSLFQMATEGADYISYNGHSDYGENVKRLESWTHVVPGHYQVFYINSCSSYSYLEGSMFKKHQQANPGAEWSRYLDIISNNNEGFFTYNAAQNQIVISALLQRKASYVDIFSQVDRTIPAQYNPGMIVVGDEDLDFR